MSRGGDAPGAGVRFHIFRGAEQPAGAGGNFGGQRHAHRHGHVHGVLRVAQLTHNTNQVWNEISPYIGRASGTYISPNDLAGYLALLLPLALAYLLVGKCISSRASC